MPLAVLVWLIVNLVLLVRVSCRMFDESVRKISVVSVDEYSCGRESGTIIQVPFLMSLGRIEDPEGTGNGAGVPDPRLVDDTPQPASMRTIARAPAGYLITRLSG